MKLKNKKTGEIGYPYFENWKDKSCAIVDENSIQIAEYASLAELNSEWEDAPEEPKNYWYIDPNGRVMDIALEDDDPEGVEASKQIGNYFESREEAEQAVERLRAWKRLEDGGITFKNWTINQTGTIDCFATWGDNIPPSRKNPCLLEDLNLLFGGEE